jgi:hypothetical protein
MTGGSLAPPSPVVATDTWVQERMAGFAHPGQESGPGLVIAPRQEGGGKCVWAADIPPIRRDPPDEPQARGGLQRDRSTTRTGGIEAGLFVLLGRTARTVRISGGGPSSLVPCHATSITERSLSGSVVTRCVPSQAGGTGLAVLL